MFSQAPIRTMIALTLASSMLVACGSDSDSEVVAQTGQFSFAVSDAPVDAADEVWACFHAIELLGNSAGKQVFTIGEDSNTIASNDVCVDSDGEVIANTRGINLMNFTGSAAEDLISGVEVPAGDYSQLRLVMADGSYVQVGDQRIPLSVPSNELKFDGITVGAGGETAYTAEFDLRQALVNPVGQDQYFLKPRGVRLVNNLTVGHIEGSMAEALLIENSCTVAPADTGTAVASVYLYPGVDHVVADLADVGGSEAVEPYAVSAVYFDGAVNYQFELGYVSAGDYILGYTCDVADDPEVDDDISLLGHQTVTVVDNGEVTTVVIE